jgi:ribosomal protein S18 acetylase RimI-like enzyme
MTTSLTTASVREIPCPLLCDIIDTGKVQTPAGKQISLVGSINSEYALALYRQVKARRPRTIVEIGMASGVASLSMLAALKEIDEGGRLITIDPFQNDPSAAWAGVGLANIQRAGFAPIHTFIEQVDYLALPKLVESGQKIQFAYIDGSHVFDYTLLDFFFVDKMMDVSGVVGFNDCGYRAVYRVLNYVKTHRKYDEVDVGLTPDYRGRNIAISLARRLMKFSQADRYFQKREQYEPSWDFYARF